MPALWGSGKISPEFIELAEKGDMTTAYQPGDRASRLCNLQVFAGLVVLAFVLALADPAAGQRRDGRSETDRAAVVAVDPVVSEPLR